MTKTIKLANRHSRVDENPPQSHRAWIPALLRLCSAQVAGKTIVALFLVTGLTPATVLAQPKSNAKSWVIWPQGGLAIPTGRFAEKDEDASAPKDGNKNGLTGGLEAGRFLSDFACVGLNYSMSSFDLDVAATPGFDHTGSTNVWVAQAWGRFFLRGGYERWQPYVFAGVGIGQPKAKLEYDPPVQFAGLPAATETLESTVSVTSTISAGIGVLVPATRTIGLSFEPRYTSVSSKGTARTDLFTQADGSQAEAKVDNEGNRLKAKSNTNWWEIRVGVVFLLRR